MAEFINTVDTLGDAVLTDSIIDRSVTEYRDNTVEIIGPYAFSGCGALTTVDCPAVTEIGNYAFRGCAALTALILRGPVLQSLGADAATDSAIAAGTGYVYVPAALYETYMLVAGGSPLAAQLRKLEEWTDDGTVDGALALEGKHAVRFFNSDGSFLGYVIVATGADATYPGSTPVYPEDSSWAFKGFEPSPTNITADMDCVAQYEEPVSFANSSWAKISEICESGKAADYFAVGDSRIIPVTISGTTHQYTARIVGINHDTKSDGAKAGISCMFFTTGDDRFVWGSSLYSGASFANSNVYSRASSFLNYVPDDLEAVIKSVRKTVNSCCSSTVSTYNMKMWVPSWAEICKESQGYTTITHGELYELFATNHYGYTNNSKTKVLTTSGSTAQHFWVRDLSDTTNAICAFYKYSDSANRVMSSNLSSSTAYLAVGFCI